MRRFILLWFLIFPMLSYADNSKPWGVAKEIDTEYEPAKVLYDVTSGKSERITNILDRVSLLSTLYGADPFDSSIVVILHGDAIPLFSLKQLAKNRDLMTRAYNLAISGVVEFRMCKASAKARYSMTAKDIHGFVKMVPMADAEIVRLQSEEGYAYMR